MVNNKDVVLITGGSGLIGQQIAKYFAPNFQVIALDIKEPKFPIPNVKFISMNVGEPSDINRALEEVKSLYGNHLASVIHLAAFYSFDVEESDLYDKITVKGTENLLSELQSFSVDQFIFSSTMLVHAPGKIGEHINENSRVDAKWAYPKSKVKAENVILKNHRNIPCLILRIAGVYDDRCHSIPIANHIERINEHHITSHFYPGDLDKGQAFVHMDDLVDALGRAVERRISLPHELTLIIGEREALSFHILQNELAQKIHGTNWITFKIPKIVAKVGAVIQERLPIGPKPFIKPWMVKLADDHYELDTNMAKTYLGWEPKNKLIDTLPKIISFLKTYPVIFYRENKITPPIPTLVSIRESLPVYIWFAMLGSLFYTVTRKKKIV